MSMSMKFSQQMELDDVKSMSIKPYPVLDNGYSYPIDYYNHSVANSSFIPTSPAFPHPFSPYNQPQSYGPRFTGYNAYPQSSDQLMSPLRSPTPAFSFHHYQSPYQRPPLTIQTQFRQDDQERRMVRDTIPPPLRTTDMMPLSPTYPTTPLQYNEQVQFLAQNPQYLSGLAGQTQGCAGKVSRAIAAQLFARDENTERFPCTLCGQTFKRINGLKRHLMMHLHIKPYKCEICNRGFCRIDVYKRHVHRGRCAKE